MRSLVITVVNLFSRIPYSLIALLGRVVIALVFFNSGQTKLQGLQLYGYKVNPFDVAPSAFYLFENEYKVPLITPWLAAHLAALNEFFLPILLVLGLATRFAAFGLLIMTAVIEIFVYPNAYVEHGLWATILLMLMAYGAGKISLDHLIWRR